MWAGTPRGPLLYPTPSRVALGAWCTPDDPAPSDGAPDAATAPAQKEAEKSSGIRADRCGRAQKSWCTDDVGRELLFGVAHHAYLVVPAPTQLPLHSNRPSHSLRRAAARRELCAMCGCLFSHSQLSRRHITGVGEPTGARCKVDSSTCSGAPRKSYRRPPAPHTAARISPLASLASWRAAGQSGAAQNHSLSGWRLPRLCG